MNCDLFLKEWGLKDIELRIYQVEGIKWFSKCIRNYHGGILADEMGLGKTIQSICAVLSLKKIFNLKRFIIISPLSVINNWKKEFTEFTPTLKFIIYMGSKENRAKIRNSLEWKSDDIILISTYEYLIQEFVEINCLNFEVLIMDEGHRIKNNDCLLYKKVDEMSTRYRFLLTGTPIQNNLDELYNLLKIVTPNNSTILPNRSIFIKQMRSKLSNSSFDFKGIIETDPVLSELLLRRTKAEVLQSLPEKLEILIFHGLTETQKNMYKSFLAKNIDLLASDERLPAARLLNTLMQVRKCVLHPYLFSGVEKEPFELGEHLVEQSAKLQAIDRLLGYLIPRGHKILLFSQMTKMLDIVQDYCYLRGLNYERLDGSVRSEERFAAISNFSTNGTTKLFLLTTRAGGQGLNLTAADTVIFIDSDFNPQVDLQAMARIHRPGQRRPCRTIRLVARHSVEEMIVFRAQQKLHVTRSILGHEDQQVDQEKLNVREMVCYGVEKLFVNDSETDNPALSDEFFTKILGETDDEGRWQSLANEAIVKEADSVSRIAHMYLFEGQDYKPYPSKKDYSIVADMAKSDDKNVSNVKKYKNGNFGSTSQTKPANSQPKINQRKLQLWQDNKYESHKVELNNDRESLSTSENNSQDVVELSLNFVVGDVFNPIGSADKLKVVCHLVDNTGSWGTGGLFSAIDRINPNLAIQYMEAREMEDLKLGDLHMLPLKSNIKVALLVAQSRDSTGRLSPIKMNHLENCLKALGQFATDKNASVHLTRLGYGTPKFNWYGIEKLIEKHLVENGIESYVYYFHRSVKRRSPSAVGSKLSETYFRSVLTNIVIYFDESVDKETANLLTRHVYALDGEITHNPVDDRISHVLFNDGSVTNQPRNAAIHYVKIEWLKQCVEQNSLIPEINFYI